MTVPRSVFTGLFQVSQFGDIETLPAPAPSPGFGSDLSAFDGLSPNGTWNLWVFDDAGADSGFAADGWRLTLDADSGAIPEPVTVTLGLLGLATLGMATRRRMA